MPKPAEWALVALLVTAIVAILASVTKRPSFTVEPAQIYRETQ